MIALRADLALFLEPMALIIVLVFLFGLVSRTAQHITIRMLSLGGLFSLAVIYSMSNPITFSDGVIVDLRSLFVGMSAALFGPLAGSVTLMIGIAMRLMIGGVGAEAGIVGMLVASGMGLLWRRYFWREPSFKLSGFAILGTMISAHLGVAFLLPVDLWKTFFLTMAPVLFISNVLGSCIIGLLIERERQIIDETETLALAAATDPLTHLMNRRSIQDQVGALKRSRRAGLGRAMLYFDIDNFKLINDIHGHAAGDDTLIEVANRILESKRQGDLACRLGGDEFLMVLPAVSAEDASAIAERFRATIADDPISTGGAQVKITVSIGMHWSEIPPDFNAQLAAADIALYRAKANGRNCVSSTTERAAELFNDRPISA